MTTTKDRKRTIAEPKSINAFTTTMWTWDLDPKTKSGRNYAMLTLPYGQLRKLVYIDVYNSFEGTGWQRESYDANVRHLRKAMLAGEYTPTVWAAALDPWHAKRLERLPAANGDPLQKQVVIHVSEDHPLPLIDGNHRRESLEQLRDAAEKQENQAAVNAIDMTAITLQVFLSSDHTHHDFLNFQMGRPVSRNQIKSMEFTYGSLPPEKVERIKFARDVARVLSGRRDSHLQSQIVFDGGGRGVQISSLTAEHSSSLATTLYGGALLAERYGKSPEWMADRYCDVYQSILEFGEDDPDIVTGLGKAIFAPKNVLTPLNLQGTRAGSHLLIGLGNCLAWRLAHLEREEPDDEDLIRVAEVASRHLDSPSIGGSAPITRRMLGLFARHYFTDMLESKNPPPEVDGVPAPLMEVLSASTFNVDNAAWKAWLKAGDDNAQADAEVDGEVEIVEPAKRRGRPRKVQPTA